MNHPKIHHLIAFSTAYMQAEEEAYKINETKDKKAWKKFKESKKWWERLMGGAYRGSYLDKQALIDRIRTSTDVYDIHEGWYDYLLIESYYLDVVNGPILDGPSFNESEVWFKFVNLGEGEYEYQQIDRPECLKGVCNFL